MGMKEYYEEVQRQAAQAAQPAPVTPPEKGLLEDMYGQFKLGLVGQGSKQLGALGQAVSPVGSSFYEAAKEFRQVGESALADPENAPSKRNTEGIRGVLTSGASGVGQMAPIIAAGLLTRSPVAAASAAGLLYGGSTYQETKEKDLAKYGLDDAYASAHPEDPRVQEAKQIGAISGVVQGTGDALSTFVGGKLIKGVAPAILKRSAADIAKSYVAPKALQNFLKAWGIEAVTEGATEAIQDETQAAAERAYNIPGTPQFGEQAGQSFEGGFGTALLLGPLTAVGTKAHAKFKTNQAALLANPEADVNERLRAATIVAADIAKDDPKAAMIFVERAEDAIRNPRPYALKLDESVFTPLSELEKIQDEEAAKAPEPAAPVEEVQLTPEDAAIDQAWEQEAQRVATSQEEERAAELGEIIPGKPRAIAETPQVVPATNRAEQIINESNVGFAPSEYSRFGEMQTQGQVPQGTAPQLRGRAATPQAQPATDRVSQMKQDISDAAPRLAPVVPSTALPEVSTATQAVRDAGSRVGTLVDAARNAGVTTSQGLVKLAKEMGTPMRQLSADIKTLGLQKPSDLLKLEAQNAIEQERGAELQGAVPQEQAVGEAGGQAATQQRADSGNRVEQKAQEVTDRFSRSEAATLNTKASQVQQWLGQQPNVTILNDFTTLFDNEKDQNAEAVVRNGKIYINASKMRSSQHAKDILFDHELRHVGLTKMFGGAQPLAKAMEKAFVGREAEVLAFALERGYTRSVAEATEEYIVSKAKEAKDQGFLSKVVAAIRTWARANGFGSLRYSNSEILKMVRESGEATGASVGEERFSRGERNERPAAPVEYSKGYTKGFSYPDVAKAARVVRVQSGLSEDQWSMVASSNPVPIALDRLATSLGAKVHLVKQSTPIFQGMYLDGSIFIDENSPAPHLFTFGHELVHRMVETEGGLYERLKTAVEPELQYQDSWNKTLGYSPEEITEEMIGDLLGERMTDPAFWNSIAKRDPTLLDKIIEYVKAMLVAVKKMSGMDQYVKDFAKVDEALQQAVIEQQQDRFSRGERNEFTSRVLEQARRADTEGVISDAKAELERVLGAEFYDRPSATARATKAAERSVLRKWATQRGLMQDPAEFDAAWTTQLDAEGKPVQGNEHDVIFNGDTVTKRNRMPNNYHESYAELFDRVMLFNWLFAPEARLTFTGFQDVEGTLMPVFTQNDLGGKVARIEETEKFLSEAFEPVGNKTASFRLKGSDIVVTDVFGNNTRKVSDQVIPMDYVVFHGKRAQDYLAYQEAQQAEINEALDEEVFDKAFAEMAGDRFSRPETITVDSKERPTTNSNGKSIHATEEGIRNFWRWFGDSKVVDEQGRPLVVYHGTGSDFVTFDANEYGKNFTGDYGVGFYFTQNEKRSNDYAQVSNGENPNVLPVYLKIENPAKVKASYGDGDLWKMVPDARSKEDLTKGLKDQGHDGVIVDGGRAGVLFVNEAVAFSPTQIKSATGNSGAFDGGNPDIRYSRPFNKQEAMDEIKSYGPTITRFLQKMASWIQPLNRRYDSLQFANSLTDEIKAVVKRMAEESNLQRIEQNRVLSTAKEVTDQWMKFGKANKDLKESMALAHDASLLQLFPGKPMTEQGWGDTPEAARKAWNKAVGWQYNKDFAVEYARITKEFNALSPETRAAYLGAVAVMADLRAELHAEGLKTIEAMPIEEAKKVKLREAMALRFRNLKGAYMPFTRHGEYVAEVFRKSDGKKVHSARAESMGSLRTDVEALRVEYPAAQYDIRTYDGRVIHQAKQNRISPALLEQMKEMLVDNLNQAGFNKVHRLAKSFLEQNVEQLSDEQRDLVKAIYKAGNLKSQAAAINALRDNVIDSTELVDMMSTMDEARNKAAANPGLSKAIDDLEQMFINTLPDVSAMKTSLHRKGMAGWNKDAIRSVLDYANRYGKSLAYMKHGRVVDQLEGEATKLAEAIPDRDQSLKVQTILKDTFENRRVVAEEEVGALGKFSTKLGSLWFLTSPSMVLVQNSQPWAITVPYLAARYGLKAAVDAMSRNHVAYQFGGKFTDKKLNLFDSDMKHAPKDWNPNLPFSLSRFYSTTNGETKAKILKSLTADEKNMLALRLGMDSGVIANSMSFEAVEYVRKGASGQFGETMDELAEKAYFFQKFGETTSRKGAYMAAFDLATKAGDSFDEATRKATEAVNETLFDYSATNRPRIIAGNFGRFFGQFRTFQFQTVGHVVNLALKMSRGDQVAKKELGLLLAANFVLAGATGLPFAGTLATMIGAFAFLIGEDDRDWLKEIEEEMLKTKLGQVAVKGLPMLVGMDLSKRIGMEGITKMFQGEPPAKATPKDRMNFYAGQLLGPAYAASAGAVFNIGQAVTDGDWGKAMEQGTPRAISSAFQAMKLNNKGLTDGNGRVIIPEDQINKWDVALMMMGVNPGYVSIAREKERNVREVTDMMDLKKQRLAKDLERAMLDNDGAGMEKAQAAIQRFNQQYPMFGFTSQALASRLRGAWQERAGMTSRKYQAGEIYLNRDEDDEEEA